jgi:transcriptional regulator with XRE-family HTH domain
MTEEKWNEKAKRLLKERNLTQRDLAVALKIGVSTVTHKLNGTREPSIDEIVDIARFFNVSIAYLIENDSDFAANDLEKQVLRNFRNMSEHEKEFTLRMLCNK